MSGPAKAGPPAEPVGFSDSLLSSIRYNSWDGVAIHLRTPGQALVPDGIVDFPPVKP